MSNRNNQLNREHVSKLPPSAQSVSEYAKNYFKKNGEVGCATSHVYKLEQAGKIKIVVFNSFNFVIPLTKN